MSAIRFISVYKFPEHVEILFNLLKERPVHMNISHEHMPSMQQHRRFVNSRPYKRWYLILSNKNVLGSIYLTKINEIGLFLFKPFSGMETQVLKNFIAKRRGAKFLANISPKNKRYKRIFQSIGFQHIQNTYCLGA